MSALSAILAGLLASQGAPAPTAEAERLGVRLARNTGIATIAPVLIEKDLTELSAEDPTLTPAERDTLFAIGREGGKTGLEQVVQAIGRAYARRLSVADLRLLVAHAETPAAQRWRRAEPAVIADAAAALGSIDLKARTAARFCEVAKKLCRR
jgi:hypothetical protein